MGDDRCEVLIRGQGDRSAAPIAVQTAAVSCIRFG